ncbi:hypothetical protein [uncultured Draconibacterium sp.]|uniref:hypothetical protein n=1 Tax=uncultured Draconibacterium sp. TaxID=1573823 RepID=UPI0029C64FD5|nr:hypothetical protein [uncultured Draconibacterium sp.]
MKKNWLIILSITLIATLILLLNLKPVFQHPNSILYSKGGDALKSYFNFSYYLKYDDGIRHDGINYPYGDHLQYINSHPLFVQFVKFIDNNIYQVANHGVAILNLTMLALFLLALPFIFLILRHYSLPRWYSGIISLIILFLSPQFDRIHGHFEMVYAVFLPMFWYFLIRWRQGKKRMLWSILLVLAAIIGGFTSAYFVAFYTILLFGVLIVECWSYRKKLSGYWKTGLYLFAIAVIPLIIIKGLVSATDWVSDRPDTPYGFYVYHANFFSIFLPPGSQLKSILGNYINMDFQWEGRAYVGLPATLLAVSIFITALLNLISKKKSSLKIFKPTKKIEVFFYASILILLFSMCIPFKYGFGWLLDILPPIKQFRALGRFTWIFFYVFTVYTAWFIYRLFRLLKIKKLPVVATVLLVFAIGYWAIDAGVNIKRSTRGLLNTNDKLESNDSEFLARFQQAKVNPDEFQAIFFLPFASTCGDKLIFEHSLNGFSEAMKCSYHTGIPLIQSFSPRLSFSQALSSIQMLAAPAIRKTRLDDMNDKPILLVCTKEKLNDREKWLQNKAEVFWEDKYITLSRLPLSVFHHSYKEWHDSVESEIPNLQSFGEIATDTAINSILFNGFENGSAKTIFSGNTSFYSRKGQQVLLDKKIGPQFQEGKYELSFWLFVDSRKYDMPKAEVKVFNAEGKQKFYKQMNTRHVHDTYQGWIRISEIVELRHEDTLQLVINDEYVSLDNLLVMPENAKVLVKTSSQNFFNNYPL